MFSRIKLFSNKIWSLKTEIYIHIYIYIMLAEGPSVARGEKIEN